MQPHIPFLKVVVDRREEAKYRRRAIRAYPNEYLEATWGFIRGTTIYICIFMPMEHVGTPDYICFEDDDLDQHGDEAKEEKLELIGTIHSHTTEDLSGEPSLLDIYSSTAAIETVIGICAIQKQESGRLRTIMRYWPRLREFDIERRQLRRPATRR